jgi:phosphatidylserine decarboxylase
VARHPKPHDDSSGVGHLVELVRSVVPPLNPAGRPFVAVPAAVAVLTRRHPLVRHTATVTAVACAAFFREPTRVPPQRPGLVLAPADGVVALRDTAVPPAELDLGSAPLPRVSVFLSVFDVHVQRSPVTATVHRVVHTPGCFRSADLAAASIDNERTSVHLRTDDGHDLAVVQIAGLIARRIVCHLDEGQHVQRGATYGLIRFGSRVDTYLPAGSRVLVDVGQRMVGAETVLAELP